MYLTAGITQLKKNKKNKRKEIVWKILGLVLRMNPLRKRLKLLHSDELCSFEYRLI